MREQNLAELAWMLEFCRGAGSVLEIGSREGATLRALANVAKPGARICSIDLPSRNPDGLGDETGEKLTQTILDLRAQGFDADVHLGDSHSPIAKRWAELRGPYDFVLIDGDHTFEGARQDWQWYGPLGKTVALHDINLNENAYAVPRVWSEVKGAGFRTVERIDGYQCGIGVVFRSAIPTKQPALSDNPNYSRAIYYDPPSHDFCSWLMAAEMMRRHHNAPAPLKVKFCLIDGQLGKIQWGPLSPWAGMAYPCGASREYSDIMMANVLRPAIEMIGAVEEPAVNAPWNLDELRAGRYVEYDHHVSILVDASRAGFEMPKWQIPQWAHDEASQFLGNSRPVIITLREMPSQEYRNSNVEEWLRFAESIKHDHDVLFLRDTFKANEPLPPWTTWPRASTNVYVRAAIYQRAFCNIMVGNGPIEWCMFSDAPFLCFKQLSPAFPKWKGGQPEGWREQCHLEVGEQWPWCSPQQRMTWTDDTFENIAQAFREFVRSAELMNAA